MSARIDWNLRMVRSREARKLLPAMPNDPKRVDWGSIRVGHLDTGYTKHPVFGDIPNDETWLDIENGLNLREEDQNPLDPLDYEGSPGHGTRIGSVLYGEADPPWTEGNASSEVGVAPRLPTIPCRIVDWVVLSPEVHRKAVAQGIQHCVRKGCAVISMSLGIPFFFPGGGGRMGRRVDDAYEKGVILVAAGGQVINSVTYPGKYGRTIGVGGITRQRRIWFEYDAGRELIDVWAPAQEVLRADSQSLEGATTLDPIEGDDPGTYAVRTDSHSGKMDSGSGTSYATAHVAAAAAMWLRFRGDEINAKYPEPWQRIEAFRLLLRQTAGKINGRQPGNGTGILNIEALLKAALPPVENLEMAPKDRGSWG